MKLLYFALILSALVLGAACSSPQPKPSGTAKAPAPKPAGSGTSASSTAKNRPKQATAKKPKKPLSALSAKDKQKKQDSLQTKPKTTARKAAMPVPDQFKAAVALFDAEDYKTACQKMPLFAQSFQKGDSLYFEALFYQSECLLVNNKLADAEKILSELSESKGIPPAIREKTLVRLGQTYCAQDQHDKAEEIFDLLKKEFPGSIYLQMANCESVQSE